MCTSAQRGVSSIYNHKSTSKATPMLLDTLLLEVSPAIAKVILKLWLRDRAVESDLSATVVDILRSLTKDALAAKTADRQLGAMSDKVALVMERLIEFRGIALSAQSREAVASTVASALNGA